MCETSEQICEGQGPTPGPWWYQEKSDAYTHIVRQGENHFICQISADRAGRSEANARLIAAAPELLSELKAVREQCLFDDDEGIGVSEDVVIPSDMFDRICAAINKAEGRS